MTTNNEITEIPERAILLLARVRADGRVNMFDARGALELAADSCDDDEDVAALEWLEAGQSRRYVAALRAMGEARAAGRLP